MDESRQTRSALGRAHLPPTKVFRRLAVNKTILKARVAAATGSQYVYVVFSRRNKISCCSAYTISEKAMRFRHPDYNADGAEKSISSSMSRHLSTRNISYKSMHACLSNLANRQTDKRTWAKTCTSSFVEGNKKCGRRVAFLHTVPRPVLCIMHECVAAPWSHENRGFIRSTYTNNHGNWR